jgi:DNA-directed RNA polymerase specialized sigma24 family protein
MPPQTPTDQELICRWQKDRDQDAAALLVHRYFERLLGLARGLLPEALRGRLDSADVVQSALGSFFRRVNAGMVPREGGDLLALLMRFVRHKVSEKIAHHQGTAKRAVGREVALDAPSAYHGLDPTTLAREPTAAEAVAFWDAVAQMLKGLPEAHHPVFFLWAEGFSVEETAAKTGRNSRWVKRVRARLRDHLGNHLHLNPQADAEEV